MGNEREVAKRGVICIRTNAQCTNKKMGDLVGRYLRNELPPDQTLSFEQHMSECIACDSTVLNWQSLKFAVARIRHTTEAANGTGLKTDR
jgi:anti-sigma factor RsiW